MKCWWNLVLLWCCSITPVFALTVSGTDVRNGEKFRADSRQRALVLIFMSTHCPCSQAYQTRVKAVAAEYPEFSFVTVVSEAQVSAEKIKAHFTALDWNIPVIWDADLKLAQQVHASRTPHVFIFREGEEAVYAGGVGDRHAPAPEAPLSDLYLARALESLRRGTPIEQPRTRVLGCAISR